MQGGGPPPPPPAVGRFGGASGGYGGGVAAAPQFGRGASGTARRRGRRDRRARSRAGRSPDPSVGDGVRDVPERKRGQGDRTRRGKD